jgi:lycopene beta-cyclase
MGRLNPYQFDYLFVGLGAANSLLLLQLHRQNKLNQKSIAIIEPFEKNVNDRTFCFWSNQDELQKLQLEHLVQKEWSKIKVSGRDEQSISPQNYYCIKGIELYNHTKSVLNNYPISHFKNYLTGEPTKKENGFEMVINDETILAKCVFDSRPPQFKTPEKSETHLYQSFFGWEIETTHPVFDTSTAVLMDFNLDQNGFCEFVYVLPFAENRALIELTRFGKEKMTEEHANGILKKYTNEKCTTYKILETEKGVIPMSSSRIDNKDFGDKWIFTGTAAGLLKPSTGYAFHAMAKDALLLTDCIENGNFAAREKNYSRFNYYDRLLLKILEKTPEKGKLIFEQLFQRVPLQNVLTFLNEQSNVKQEITIFSKLPKRLFLNAALNDFITRLNKFSPSFLSLAFCLLSCILYVFKLNHLVWVILGVGFFTIGLSHGSLDHLSVAENNSRKQLLLFVMKYLLLASFLALGWFFFPDVALAFFILYSALHFGETDFKEWNYKSNTLSFLWGLNVLSIILIFHFQEVIWVLQQIPNIKTIKFLMPILNEHLNLAKIITVFAALLWPLFIKHKSVLITILFLLISSMLPLIVSFGIYFIFQHSIQGWKHLKSGFNKQSAELWSYSLPFVVAATIIIIGGLTIMNKNMWGIFFILLSCMSMPHVLYMNKFYKRIRLR